MAPANMPATRRMGACETTPPTTRRGHRPAPQASAKGPSSPPHDRPPLVGVQLVRPRRYAAAGTPAGPLPHDGAARAAARKIPKNSQPGCNRSHRARRSHPLDNNGPHGCRRPVLRACRLPRRSSVLLPAAESLGRSLRSRRMRSASPNPDTASARWGFAPTRRMGWSSQTGFSWSGAP
jgi:hypothetical protein